MGRLRQPHQGRERHLRLRRTQPPDQRGWHRLQLHSARHSGRPDHGGNHHHAMARLLDAPSPPDAVFCFNDLRALGAPRTVPASGRRVPEDVTVGRPGDQGP
ncbi:MAG: substrate-binding domain-containing protein [Nonomuraea sp.]|nr:substrate-binding domain-containing protein [Nonomuraea sp.]